MKKSKVISAIFLDRDGVLIEDNGPISSLEQASPLPGARMLLKTIKNLKIPLFLITNQSLAARGEMSIDDVINLNRDILNRVYGDDTSDLFTKEYVALGHPHAQIKKLCFDDPFRKPNSGAFLDAQKAFEIDLCSSIMIGDRVSDMIAGNRVGVEGFLLRNVEEKKNITGVYEAEDELKKESERFSCLEELIKHILKFSV